MRCTLFVILFVFGVSGLAVATPTAPAEKSERSEQAELQARMIRVARTLMTSPAPAERSAGLLLAEQAKLWRTTAQPVLSEAEFVNDLHVLIEEADSALTRALLAQLCGMTDRVDDCRRRGLDDAIVALDGAELLARLHLTEHSDLERTRDVMVAADHLAPGHPHYGLLLLDAMEAHSDALPDGITLLAIVVPFWQSSGLGQMAQLCQQPAADDPQLDRACDRILDAMMDQPASLLFTTFASSIKALRAEARGETGAVSRHESWRSDLYEWVRCVGAGSEGTLEAGDAPLVREFLEHWQRFGEVSAHVFLASQAGLDCGLPEPPPARADASN
jgi:hypothetical protein